MTTERAGRRLALVLWNGDVGGAEVLSAALADKMRQMDTEATIVFVEKPHPLVGRLEALDLPYTSLGFGRGRDILQHPRRFATEVARVGPDGALLVTCGYMGGALRAGGYRGTIVAVEHGDVLYEQRRQPLRWLTRVTGAWADDAHVAVSDFILRCLIQEPHVRGARRIYNGIDPNQYASDGVPTDRPPNGDCVIAFAGRLVHGKGADYLMEAMAKLPLSTLFPVKLLIAGEGPERPRLEALARLLGLDRQVEFLGLKHDMPSFWRRCDIAVVPSAEFVESCPMTPLEAMASGKPVVATRNGGLPELVVDGKTGSLVPPSDAAALAKAVAHYVDDEKLRGEHGAAGRTCVADKFHIDRCAQEYLSLFDEVAKGK
jgi:glycosyltransferase involved in cell wall biosynthesis